MIRALGYLIAMSTTAVIFAYALGMFCTQDLGRPADLTARMTHYEQILTQD
jgi:hypothetical protein